MEEEVKFAVVRVKGRSRAVALFESLLSMGFDDVTFVSDLSHLSLKTEIRNEPSTSTAVPNTVVPTPSTPIDNRQPSPPRSSEVKNDKGDDNFSTMAQNGYSTSIKEEEADNHEQYIKEEEPNDFVCLPHEQIANDDPLESPSVHPVPAGYVLVPMAAPHTPGYSTAMPSTSYATHANPQYINQSPSKSASKRSGKSTFTHVPWSENEKSELVRVARLVKRKHPELSLFGMVFARHIHAEANTGLDPTRTVSSIQTQLSQVCRETDEGKKLRIDYSTLDSRWPNSGFQLDTVT